MKRPNYFVALRLNDCLELVDKVSTIQQTMIQRAPQLTRCMTSSKKIHITFCVMELKDSNEVDKAKTCLNQCQGKIKELISNAPASCKLTFDDLGSFNGKVLFASPQHNPSLQLVESIRNIIYNEFRSSENGLSDCVTVDEKFVPHVTIAKTSADRKNGRNLKIQKNLFEDLSSYVKEFECPISQIDLLSMTEIEPTSGYYRSLASFSFVDT